MGNDCCTERVDTDKTSKPLNLLDDGGMTADKDLNGRPLPVKEKYWEDYEPARQRNTLKLLLDNWPERGDAPYKLHYVEIAQRRMDTGDIVKPGCISWDEGDVRATVRMFITGTKVDGAKGGDGKDVYLPVPACSKQVWHQFWTRHATHKKDAVDLITGSSFCHFFVNELYRLCSANSNAILVAPKVYVGGDEKNTKKDWHKAYEPHVEKIKDIVDKWDEGHIDAEVEKMFREVDKNGDGHLQWNQHEVWDFVMDVFKEHNIPAPNPPLSESDMYLLYRKFNVSGKPNLDFKEAENFAKFIHNEILKGDTNLDKASVGGELDVPIAPGVAEVETYKHRPPGSVPAPVLAPAPVVAQVPPHVQQAAIVNKPFRDMTEHHANVANRLENWDSGTVEKVFNSCDDGDGELRWNNHEIMDFVNKLFAAKGMPPPAVGERTYIAWYQEVDHNHSGGMSKDEAKEFAKHVFERILQLHGQDVPQPVSIVKLQQPMVPVAPVRTYVQQPYMQAQPRPVQLVQTYPPQQVVQAPPVYVAGPTFAPPGARAVAPGPRLAPFQPVQRYG